MLRPQIEELATDIQNNFDNIVKVIENYEAKIADLKRIIQTLNDKEDDDSYIRELESEIDERDEDIRILTDQLKDSEYLVEELRVTINNLSK